MYLFLKASKSVESDKKKFWIGFKWSHLSLDGFWTKKRIFQEEKLA